MSLPVTYVESGYWLNYSELDGIMLAQVSRGNKPVVV